VKLANNGLHPTPLSRRSQSAILWRDGARDQNVVRKSRGAGEAQPVGRKARKEK